MDRDGAGRGECRNRTDARGVSLPVGRGARWCTRSWGGARCAVATRPTSRSATRDRTYGERLRALAPRTILRTKGHVSALAKRVRELATTASKIDDQDAHATTYGELLSTCAGCHALVRPDPVPGP